MKTNTTLILNHVLWRGLYFFSVLLINIGIARFFAAEKSGQIFYIVNNLALILLLVSLCLESGATYFISSGKLEASGMARFCWIWATTASFIALAIWLIILHFEHSMYGNNIGFILASFLFIAGVLYTTYFTALFYAKKEFSLPNKILFLVNFLVIVLLITEKNNIFVKTHFIKIYFSGFFLQGILLNIFFFRNELSPGQASLPDRPMLKKVIQYSATALVSNLIYFLVNRIDYWFVQYFCSAKDLGNYIQASKLGQMMLILPGILGATLFPIFSSREKSGNEAQLTAVIRVLLWINGILCLLIVCFGWIIIPFLFGTSFNNMYSLFVLLIPGILCVTMNYPITAWFSSASRIGINIRGSLLALLLICAGDLFALPRFGVVAAPVVSSAGYISYFCYTVFVFRRENAAPWKDFLRIRKTDISRIRQMLSNKIQGPDAEYSTVQNSTT
jgi:O-antigen/teichoic acid export membrane protein